MGVQQSIVSFSQNPDSTKLKPMKEKDRYGLCTVKIATIVPAGSPRRNQERIITHNITPKGGIIHGSQCNPQLIQRGLSLLILFTFLHIL